jgi:hypothetical protein
VPHDDAGKLEEQFCKWPAPAPNLSLCHRKTGSYEDTAARRTKRRQYASANGLRFEITRILFQKSKVPKWNAEPVAGHHEF